MPFFFFFLSHQISFISKRRGEASVWIRSVSSQQKYSTGWYTGIFLMSVCDLLSVRINVHLLSCAAALSTEHLWAHGDVLQIIVFAYCLVTETLSCLEKGLPANGESFPFQINTIESVHTVWKIVLFILQIHLCHSQRCVLNFAVALYLRFSSTTSWKILSHARVWLCIKKKKSFNLPCFIAFTYSKYHLLWHMHETSF